MDNSRVQRNPKERKGRLNLNREISRLEGGRRLPKNHKQKSKHEKEHIKHEKVGG